VVDAAPTGDAWWQVRTGDPGSMAFMIPGPDLGSDLAWGWVEGCPAWSPGLPWTGAVVAHVRRLIWSRNPAAHWESERNIR
jgi:hypothetical protein